VAEYVLTLLVTAAVTYLLTPLVRRVAIAGGAMHEARDRDVHVVPIPLLGGIAMFGGLAAGLVVAAQLTPLGSVLQGNRTAASLLLAGGVIVLVGVVDDRWGLGPISKLAGQAVAGGILVWGGAQLSWVPLPHDTTLFFNLNQSTALSIFLVVATINAVNFIDGLDGLAAGIVCIAAIAFFAYYYRLTLALHLPDQAGPALASALLAGACLGFLPHNFYPARIFMGDTGSMLLGLLLAYVPISSINSLDPATLGSSINRFPEVLPLLLPATILVIPYADLLLAVVRRTRAGLSPLAPDRKHLHHRLLDIGHSHRSSVLIMYLWAALFSGAIVWLSVARTKLFVFAVVTVAAMVLLVLLSMPRLRPWGRRRRASAAASRTVAARAAAARSAAAKPAPVASAARVPPASATPGVPPAGVPPAVPSAPATSASAARAVIGGPARAADDRPGRPGTADPLTAAGRRLPPGVPAHPR
jgi:UDP-GlcNAc:undecaprenyl-phosphate GlcNAc-1-phosphate transferase